MLKEFKEFALKGNVMDLAIGVIIGAAFGAIVSSMVDDVLMPVIGAITGGLDFTNYFVGLSSAVTAETYEEAQKQGATLGYGKFITAAVKFGIIAFCLFLVVKAINNMKRKDENLPPPSPPAQEVLLMEIRDLLAKSK